MPRRRPPVNLEVLRWAVAESGLSLPELAERLKLDTDSVESWIAGDDSPTKGQLTKLAATLRLPLRRRRCRRNCDVPSGEQSAN